MKHEAIEQKAVVQYLKLRGVLFTATLGGLRLSIGQATQLKSSGYGRGVPDILIFEPRGEYHGLMIELKRTRVKGQNRGKISPEQRWWKEELNKRGYCAVICEGASEAINFIDTYLKQI